MLCAACVCRCPAVNVVMVRAAVEEHLRSASLSAELSTSLQNTLSGLEDGLNKISSLLPTYDRQRYQQARTDSHTHTRTNTIPSPKDD